MKKTAKHRLWSLLSTAVMFLYAVPALASAPAEVIGQPVPEELGLQPAASPMREQMIQFHDHLLLPIITVITAFVMLLLLIVIVRFNARANPVPSKTTHNTMLEIIWTLVPVLILIVVVIPSMKMLYYIDRTKEADMTLKVIGNQWYWGYEYPDNGDFSFLSNLVKDKDLKPGQVRLLSVDNPVYLPINKNIRLLITASDVIHSWSVPALGIKLDAVPGRTNETWVRIDKEGTFYGQCSQLCGDGHGFMPIEVHGVTMPEFEKWVRSQGGKMPSEASKEKGAANAAEPAMENAQEPAAVAPPVKAGTNKKAGTGKKEEKAGDK